MTTNIFDNLMQNDLASEDMETETPQSKVDKVLARIDKAGYNTKEMADIIKNTSRYQLVESVAGSGKTTTMNFKLLADSYSGRAWGKPIWVSTFLKSGAENMKQDFYNKIRDLDINIPLSNIKFSTIHSEFYNVLHGIGLNINIISSTTDRELKNNVSKDLGIGNHPGYLTNGELQTFNIIETYINSCVDKPDTDRLEELGLADLGVRNAEVMLLACKTLYEKRLSLELYNFDDLQRILYDYLIVNPNPSLINIVSNRYKYIYIDEFQDTSRIQYEILKFYCRGAEQVMFVGDSDQSIYSWRGADINIITKDVQKDFDTDLKHLSYNYRVPSNILDPIAKSIVHNQNRIPKDIIANKQGGVVTVRSFVDTLELDKFMYDSLLKSQGDTLFQSVAVLSSLNRDITGLALNLLLSGDDEVDFSIGGTIQDLRSKGYKDFWRLAKLFSNDPNADLRDNIRFLSGNMVYRNKAIRIEETLRNSQASIFNVDPNTLKYSMGNAPRFFGWYRFMMSLDEEERSGLSGVRFTMAYLNTYYKQELQDNTGYRSITEENLIKTDLFMKIIDNLGEKATVDDFLLKIDDLNRELHNHYELSHAKIILTTPFDFKGKEADLTFIYKDTKYNFPRAKSLESNYEEERRLHYIAGTRAKKACVYTTIDDMESPFLLETGLSAR